MTDMIYTGSIILATLLFTASYFVHPPDFFKNRYLYFAVFFIQAYRNIESKFLCTIFSLLF